MTDPPSRRASPSRRCCATWRESRTPRRRARSPARAASTAASRSRTRRRPAWPCPASTPTSAAGACWSSARARSATSSRSTPDARDAALRRVFSHALPCVLITGGFAAAGGAVAEADRAGVPLLRTRDGTPDAMARLGSAPRHLPGAARHRPRRADGHPRPGRARGRRERHRQERVRARPGRPRPSAGRRRRRGAALPRASRSCSAAVRS